MDIDTLCKKIAGTFPALSHRNFRLFWFGQCISLIGTWMQNIGQSWLVLKLTNSAFKLGVVNALQFLPMMVLSLFAGTLVDKFPKRKVLIFTQTSLMVLAFILATVTYLKVVQYWHILVLALLLGVVNTLDMPTRQSFFIELVGKDHLMNAITLNSTIFNLARIAGPALAGILIGFLGIAVCFYLNALSFLAVIAGLWMMDIPSVYMNKTDREGVFKSTRDDIVEGLKYLFSMPVIYLSLILLAVISTFTMNFNVLIPIFANRNLGQNAMGYGLLMTAMGTGSFVGALSLAAKSRVGPKMKILMGGALGMSAFTVLLGFVKNYYIACTILLIIGFCSIAFTASVNTVIQLNSADNMRGRVMSVYSLVFGGVTPIGSLYSGKLAEVTGAPGCLIASGIIGIAAVLVILAAFFRYERKQ